MFTVCKAEYQSGRERIPRMRWVIKDKKADIAYAPFKTKADAVDFAKVVARKELEDLWICNPHGKVIEVYKPKIKTPPKRKKYVPSPEGTIRFNVVKGSRNWKLISRTNKGFKYSNKDRNETIKWAREHCKSVRYLNNKPVELIVHYKDARVEFRVLYLPKNQKPLPKKDIKLIEWFNQ
jgi:hypothetical protein